MTISFMSDGRLHRNGEVIKDTDGDQKINVEVEQVQSSNADNSAELSVVSSVEGHPLDPDGTYVKAVRGGDLKLVQNNYRDISKLIENDTLSGAEQLDNFQGVAHFGVKDREAESFRRVKLDYDFSAWVTQNNVLTYTGYEDPFGGTNACLVKEQYAGGASTTHYIYNPNMHYFSSGTQNRVTVYAKAATRRWIYLSCGYGSAYFDLYEGAVGTYSGVSATIEGVGNGWYKCQLLMNAGGTLAYQAYIYIAEANGDTSFVGGNPNADSVYLYKWEDETSITTTKKQYKALSSPWALTEHDSVPSQSTETGQALHSTGTSLIKVGVRPVPLYDGSTGTILWSNKRDDTTKVWGPAKNIDFFKTNYGAYNLDPSPTMITIPDVGTILFCFGIDYLVDTSGATYKIDKIFAYITTDDGDSWSKYSEILVDPYYGTVYSPPTYGFAIEQVAVLKAIYHDNKVVLGMMLTGSQGATFDTVGNPAAYGKIMNIMYSNDLGKSFTTVKENFILSTFEYSRTTKSIIYGDPHGVYTDDVLDIPSNFGLGYDYHSGKFVLVMRGSGVVNRDFIEPSIMERYENINKWFFFYNVGDSLDNWEASKVTGKNYKMIDSFVENKLDENYYTYVINSTPTWRYTGHCLSQDAQTNAAPTTGYASQGAHLIYKLEDDPTNNRKIGARVELSTTNPNTNFGLLFCYQDVNNYYAVVVAYTGNNYTRGIYLKRVLSGVETLLTWTTIYWDATPRWGANVDPWREVSVRFFGHDYIRVCVDDETVLAWQDNSIRSGKIGLVSNSNSTLGAGYEYKEGFRNLGLLTSPCSQYVIPGHFSDTYVVADNEKLQESDNMEITNDHNNQTWIAANVTSVDRDYNHGILYTSGTVLQKFRLEKEIVRVEGKFLGKESYQVKFGDEKDYQYDSGYFLNPIDWGVLNTNYAGGTYWLRPRLRGFAWHNDMPALLTASYTDGNVRVGLLTGNGYTNHTINQVLNSRYSVLTVPTSWSTAQSGRFGGYGDVAASSVFYGDDFVRIRIPGDSADRAAPKYYDPANNNMVYANTSYTDPIVSFDFHNRGCTIFLKFRTYENNIDNFYYRFFTLYMPAITANGVTGKGILLRLKVYCNNDGGGYFRWERFTGSWATVDTVYNFDTSCDRNNDWYDIAIHVVPVVLSTHASYPDLHAFIKRESEDTWETMLPNLTNNLYNIPYYNSTSYDYAYVQFGSIDTSASTNTLASEFKLVAYSDTCYYDPHLTPILGTQVESGVPIKLLPTKITSPNTEIAISGGKVATDDEWHITDVTDRSFGKNNAIDHRASTQWRSNGELDDKYLILDAGQRIGFDSVVLYGTNCYQIEFDYNTTNSFPNNPITLDMSFLTSSGYIYDERPNFILNTVSQETLKDEYVNKIMMIYQTSPGYLNGQLYRVLGNESLYYTLYSPTDYPTWPTYSYFQAYKLISDRIAFKLDSRLQARYFKITFKTLSASTYGANKRSTPEGYFTLGYVNIGDLVQFEYNPEYPEILTSTPVTKYEKLQNGSTMAKPLGKTVTKRTLNFNAVDYDPREFADELIYLWKNRVVPVTYIPNILDIRDAGNGLYKTFDIMACYMPPKIKFPKTHGGLIDMAIELEENMP